MRAHGTEMRIEARVTDSARHTESGYTRVVVSESPLIMSVLPYGGRFVPGEENIFYVIVSHPDGRPAKATVTALHYTIETDALGIAKRRCATTGSHRARRSSSWGWRCSVPAIRGVDRAIELPPSFASAYMNRGNVLRELGDRRAALADFVITRGGSFSRAIVRRRAQTAQLEQWTPRTAKQYALRGELRASLGDVDGARTDLARAVHFAFYGLAETRGTSSRSSVLCAREFYIIELWELSARLSPSTWTTRSSTSCTTSWSVFAGRTRMSRGWIRTPCT